MSCRERVYGPNAIIRVAEALQHQLGASITAELFALAGLSHYLAAPPQQMVDEGEARRLHMVLRSELGPRVAAEVSREAGVATAEYLLGGASRDARVAGVPRAARRDPPPCLDLRRQRTF